MTLDRRSARSPSNDPTPWLVQIAKGYGFTEADLRRVHREIGVWPTDEQMKAAAARRVAIILLGKAGAGD